MQLKGLVKLFTGILILYCLYQISYTFIVRGTDQKLRAKAEKQAKAANPGITGAALTQATDARLAALTDSVQGEKIVGTLFGKVSYADAKKKELNLGLDLQGGMSVTLDVSLNDLVRSMSNNPSDAALTNAIAEADRQHVTSDKDFASLFRQAFEARNPNVKMAYLFTKPNFTDITLQSTNEQVESVIRRNGTDAIESTYGILQKRIDKFGVSQPTINLDKNRGIITVELAGVKNPERVHGILEATANLQFFETFTNAEIYQSLEAANDALAAKLSGKSATDTNKQSTVVAGDTTGNKTDTTGNKTASLDQFQGAGAGSKDTLAQQQAENEAKYPLLGRMIIPQELQQRPGPVVCYIAKADTAKVMGYLRTDVVRNKFPNTVRFMFGAESGDDKFNAKAPLALYAIKTAPGTPNGSRLEGNHVVDARMDLDQLSGKPQVLMDMDPNGSRIWSKMTADNINKSVAVVLDDRVYSAPNVENQIDGGSTVISGRFSVQEATDLANILKIGKLPARPRIVQEQVVGPSLGKENVSKGMNSLLIAFAVIFVLMLVYYNTAGMVANIALILNLLFTIGILIDLGATLTMPGIAGLVLTIGMAVDTNVIIFERIKEELALGKSYELAVSEGYKRSYAPVLDGHITQLLTAIILFVAGLGPVKGFATTQILGLLLSLFCGIVVSRLVTDMWMSRGKHFNYFTALSKSIFRKAHFRFIEFRKVTYVISGIVLALGIASYFHGYDKGVEFAGGRSYTVHFDKKVNEDDVRQKLATYLETQPVVKTVGTNNDLNITTTYLVEETGQDEAVQRRLYEGLSKSGLITTANYDEFAVRNLLNRQKVTATISKKLQKDAITATAIALAAIFLYIFIRFRKWQYSVGTIIALLHDVCITLAVFSFLRGVVPFPLELDQHFIAAILTVIGFSMNDTVIVFDRVREYFRKSPGERKESVINRAINDTLSRTVMTSLTVFLTVLILFIFGGDVTRGFAFAMLIGVITGTYSSIFVAAPILVDMDRGDSLKNEVDRTEQIEELKKLA